MVFILVLYVEMSVTKAFIGCAADPIGWLLCIVYTSMSHQSSRLDRLSS